MRLNVFSSIICCSFKCIKGRCIYIYFFSSPFTKEEGAKGRATKELRTFLEISKKKKVPDVPTATKPRGGEG